MKRLLFSVLAASLLGASALSAAVATGSPAPEFRLPDSTGTSHNLSDFRGKTVVLEWTNHDCPFVVKHYVNGDMQRLQREYANKGVIWLRIISSAPGTQGYLDGPAATALATRQDVGATATLLDPNGTVGRQFEARTTPHMFVIDPMGVVVYQGAIDSIRSANAGDVARAENYVKSALDAVLENRAVATTDTRPYGCSVKYKSD